MDPQSAWYRMKQTCDALQTWIMNCYSTEWVIETKLPFSLMPHLGHASWQFAIQWMYTLYQCFSFFSLQRALSDLEQQWRWIDSNQTSPLMMLWVLAYTVGAMSFCWGQSQDRNCTNTAARSLLLKLYKNNIRLSTLFTVLAEFFWRQICTAGTVRGVETRGGRCEGREGRREVGVW